MNTERPATPGERELAAFREQLRTTKAEDVNVAERGA
jgi:hypothetical protein